ncbi:MAG: hypothetical protein NTV97_06735 [Alphaproteobacteria bacterium]|nr:hypothetical protein [Alphaproteobacteria bacterium]
MQSRRIASTPLDGLIAVGRASDRDFAQLSAYAAAHPELGEGIERLFAEPVATRDGNRIDWYAEGSGRCVAADTLDATRQGDVLMRVDRMLSAIRREGERLTAAGDPLGSLLTVASETPTPLDRYVYVQEGASDGSADMPVVVCWGYAQDWAHRTGAAPQILVARPDPTPPPVAPVPAATFATVPAVAPAQGLRWWWPLWLLLALILLGIAWMLLRACGMGLPGDATHGWRYCRPPTEALAGDIERGRRLDDIARQLELQLVQNRLTCVANTPPPLPKDRWLGKDLSILAGCWSLGRDTQSLVVDENGKQQQCTVRAGTICFSADGSGTREQTTECGSERFSTCKADIKARFNDAGALETEQPDTKCDPPTITWLSAPNRLTCKRVDDNGALCKDGVNFEHEFRRKANQ